jgi:TPP-dependent pyruvate/acetoin dehydrogenase alpha subunit
MHTTVDDPSKYRDDEEVEKWEKREPLIRFRQYLKNRDLLTDEKDEELEARLEKRIAESIENAERMMREADTAPAIFEHLFAETSPALGEQRAEFEARQRTEQPGKQKRPRNKATRREKTNAPDDDGAGAESGAA